MSIFRCHSCDQDRDNDHDDGCRETTDGLICGKCVEREDRKCIEICTVCDATVDMGCCLCPDARPGPSKFITWAEHRTRKVYERRLLDEYRKSLSIAEADLRSTEVERSA